MNIRLNPSAPGEARSEDLAVLEDAPALNTEETAEKNLRSVQPSRTGGLRPVLIISVPVLLAAAGGYLWLSGGRFESTDNAYVQQAIVSLSADIPGRVIEVDVKENQLVKAGDMLFRIDAAPYQIALDQANASLASARLDVEQLRVNYTTALSKRTVAQQALAIQQRARSRNTDLARKGIATTASVDDALLAVQQAQSNVDLAQQGVAGAAAALGSNPDIKTDDHPSVKTALAAVENARRNLDRTAVVAPSDGIVSQISSLNVGQFLATGSTIASLVTTSGTWVDANFKETQLGSIKGGQVADVTIDAYPGVTLHGTVDGIAAATGSEFSLIPAQNATGNWVKVVQRVPIRIKVSLNDGMPLRSGMSASVTVDTGRSRLDALY